VLGILAVAGGEWDEASARVDAALEIAARTHAGLARRTTCPSKSSLRRSEGLHSSLGGTHKGYEWEY
jgi:hypothetical protein